MNMKNNHLNNVSFLYWKATGANHSNGFVADELLDVFAERIKGTKTYLII